jgi:hypothetical protein
MANDPPGYLRVLFEHYDNWSRQLAERWSENTQNAANGTLDPKKVLGDAVYLANQGIMGLWAPLLVGKFGGYPRVDVILHVGDQPQAESIPFIGDSTKTLTVSALSQVGGGKTIASGPNGVSVAFIDGDTRLEVTVDLAGVNEAANESYEGTVMLDGEIVAIARAEITP